MQRLGWWPECNGQRSLPLLQPPASASSSAATWSTRTDEPGSMLLLVRGFAARADAALIAASISAAGTSATACSIAASIDASRCGRRLAMSARCAMSVSRSRWRHGVLRLWHVQGVPQQVAADERGLGGGVWGERLQPGCPIDGSASSIGCWVSAGGCQWPVCRKATVIIVMVMVIYSALVRSHQSTSAGSLGLVRPAWI
jgi:hypothetical protein